MAYQVGYLVGSLSSTSVNRELSQALIRLAPADLQFTEIPIRDLPLYSPDHDENYPPEAVALKDAIHRFQAILFVTPEYNRSIPGVEERHRLGLPALGPERVRSHANGRDRGVDRADRHPRWPSRACVACWASATPGR